MAAEVVLLVLLVRYCWWWLVLAGCNQCRLWCWWCPGRRSHHLATPHRGNSPAQTLDLITSPASLVTCQSDTEDQMTIKMEAIADLPEIKSELNTDDFGSHNPVVTTNSHTPQPQQPQHEQQQNNCQWVSRTTFFLLRSSWCLVVLSPGQKSL